MKKSSPKPRRQEKKRSGSDTEQRSPEVLALAGRLHSAAIDLLRRVRKQDASSGVGPARLSALSVLVFGGPKTLGELAATERVKPPTMSRIVTGLARSRLIEITADSADARRLQIRASAKGERLLQVARGRRIASLAEPLQRLPPKDFTKLQQAAQILSRVLVAWR